MIDATYDFVVRFLTYIRTEADTEPGDVNILTLKGVVPSTFKGDVSHLYDGDGLVLSSDVPDQYNDTIIAAWKGRDGAKHVTIAVGTMEPGRYYTNTDPHPLGAAHLTFGQHLYVPGFHNGNQAFRALNEKNRIWRDKNGNFQPDIGEVVYTGVYGINIHAGGKTSSIGMHSAGCINVAGGTSGGPWKAFLDLRNLHFVANHKPFVRVNVWRGQDALALFEDRATRPTLIMGIKNLWVAEMQGFLNEAGFYMGAIDGDWGTRTTDAVVRFQAANGLVSDGWCGGKTWAALTE